MEGLKQNHTAFMNEKAKRDAHHASLAERVDFIEKQLGDSADRHGRSPRSPQMPLLTEGKS